MKPGGMSSLDDILDSIAIEFLEVCEELMTRRTVLDDLLAESSIHLARTQLSNSSTSHSAALALSMLQFNPSLTPLVTVVPDQSSIVSRFSQVSIGESTADVGGGGGGDTTSGDVNRFKGSASSLLSDSGETTDNNDPNQEDSGHLELVCEWDKSTNGNNNGASLIPGSSSHSVSVSLTTPSSIKSAKYYYQKSIEEIVYVATLQNKMESLRKQYAKLRKLKLSKQNQDLIQLHSGEHIIRSTTDSPVGRIIEN